MGKKTAIILGATGLTGQLLLSKLVDDDNYSQIKLFSRRASGNTSTKIKEFTGDVLQLENFRDNFTGDEIFCCVGTTSAKTKDREIYRAVDYGIPVTAAKLAVENMISTIIIVSALGSNPNSKIFYSRTKGEMEQDVLNLKIPNTYILRPSLIVGKREENRFGESLAAGLSVVMNFVLVGKAKKYRSIQADTIADAMIQLAKERPELLIVDSDIIQKLGEDI